MNIDEVIVGDISTPEGREEIMAKVAEMTNGMDEEARHKVMHLVGKKLDEMGEAGSGGKKGRELFILEGSIDRLTQAFNKADAAKGALVYLAQCSDVAPHIHQFGEIDGMLTIACGALHTVQAMLTEAILPRYKGKEAEPEPASPDPTVS